ncbi:MAG: hypothetical protein KGL39_43430 [Patescibacteria group bacterium]|nr:hypothetical protein [Patescibacteria group bacterium]
MNEARLKVTVSASLRTSDGTVVEIDERIVSISKLGPKGGAGATVTIPLNEWDAVNTSVEQVRDAIAKARGMLDVPHA